MTKRTTSRLSPQGQQRRRNMLGQLQSEMDTVQRRRQLKRQMMAGVALVLLVLAGSLWSAGVLNRPGSETFVNESSDEPASRSETADTMVVYNRPGLVRQLVVRNRDARSSSFQITRLSNEDLELLLAEHGHPFSVASIDDRLVAVSNAMAPE